MIQAKIMLTFNAERHHDVLEIVLCYKGNLIFLTCFGMKMSLDLY